MKINGIGQSRTNVSKTKRAKTPTASFQELLQTRLEEIHSPAETAEASLPRDESRADFDTIRDAARLLDEALEQIRTNGQPSPEIAGSLNLLHEKLTQGGDCSDDIAEASAIISTETGRLQSWGL